ncbi:hypothetical protein HDE_03839 [Halotydeus destructor]|nr:hypothetical protein HDE_03839 [Halotydeus destructor]
MIGALAIKSKRMKNRIYQRESLEIAEPEAGFKTRCNFLYMAAGSSILISLIILIPAILGKQVFYVYSGAFFGIAMVLFTVACLLHSDPRPAIGRQGQWARDKSPVMVNTAAETDPVYTVNVKPNLIFDTNVANHTVQVSSSLSPEVAASQDEAPMSLSVVHSCESPTSQLPRVAAS